jgi:hypothetical protein
MSLAFGSHAFTRHAVALQRRADLTLKDTFR